MAHTIKTETNVGGNTADRVGSAFEGVADALEGTEQIAEMDKAVQEVQHKVEASKAQIQTLVNALPVVQQTGDSTTSVMSQKAVTDALKTSADSGFSETPYISNPLNGFMYEIMINVKSGDKYHYQGTVENGKWGITMYSDAALTVVSKTLVSGEGSVHIDVEGIFDQEGWCVV